MQKDTVDAGKTVHDAMIDRAKLGVEQGKVGLGHRQADLAEQQHATDTALAGAEHQHKTGIDSQKLGIEGQKLGIAQQAADTDTHTALHPPKPAAGKPKKKKK